MRPNLKDVLRTLGALPFLAILSMLGRNEYLFVPTVGKAGACAVIAAGLAWRIWKKDRAYTPFWLLVFLSVYNVPMSFGGYAYTGLWMFPISAACFAAGFVAWRKAHIVRRAGLGILIASLLGIFLLHFYRNLDFDETLGRCERDNRKIDPAVKIFDRNKHPYDFVVIDACSHAQEIPPYHPEPICKLRGYAPYGLEHKVRVFDMGSDKLTGEIKLPGEGQVQRVKPGWFNGYLFAPVWGRWGMNEEVLLLDRWDDIVTKTIPIGHCRNLCAVAIDEIGERLYGLCEVSHTLVSVHLDYPHLNPRQEKYVVLPGRDAYDLAFDKERHRIFTSDFFSPTVTVVNADTLAIEKEIRLSWMSAGLLLHKDHLYVTQPLESEIVEVDAETLTVTRRFEAGYGARDLDIDEARGVLFSGNYLAGTLDAIRLADGKKIKEAYAGILLRGIHADTKTDRLYLATGCGVKYIQLGEWLGESQK
jgi:hypothetical protein